MQKRVNEWKEKSTCIYSSTTKNHKITTKIFINCVTLPLFQAMRNGDKSKDKQFVFEFSICSACLLFDIVKHSDSIVNRIQTNRSIDAWWMVWSVLHAHTLWTRSANAYMWSHSMNTLTLSVCVCAAPKAAVLFVVVPMKRVLHKTSIRHTTVCCVARSLINKRSAIYRPLHSFM